MRVRSTTFYVVRLLMQGRPVLTYRAQEARKPATRIPFHSLTYTSTASKNGEKAEDAVRWEHPGRFQGENYDHISVSRINFARLYTVEHSVKVHFIGKADEANMEKLLAGDTANMEKLLTGDSAWDWSDTGESIPIRMEDETRLNSSHRSCRCRLLEKHSTSNTTLAFLGLSSGLLMSSSFVWLNERMELYEASVTMSKVLQDL